MEQQTTNIKQDIKLSISGFIIAIGLLTVMFHMVLFPIIAIVIGIPWMAGSVAIPGANYWRNTFKASKASKACLPGFRWQQSCR